MLADLQYKIKHLKTTLNVVKEFIFKRHGEKVHLLTAYNLISQLCKLQTGMHISSADTLHILAVLARLHDVPIAHASLLLGEPLKFDARALLSKPVSGEWPIEQG